MIKQEHFNKIFHSLEGKETLYTILEDYNRTKAFRLNWQQKLLINRAANFLGQGKVNLNCGSCLSTGMNKILNYLNTYVQAPEVKTVPKITKKKVSKKATETKADALPTNYMSLKKYAEEKLGKKYPKGTKKKTILKDLGV